MKCPFCKFDDSIVIETRKFNEQSIKRRRECLKCKKRFNTYEVIDNKIPLIVEKKNKSEELFDRSKIIKSIMVAINKTKNKNIEFVNDIVVEVEKKIDNRKKIKSIELGELVMNELIKYDEVAYIRFASVYKDFSNIADFIDELDKIVKK